MATASVTYSFTDGTVADADEVNQNFTDLVNFLNASVVHADGGVAMSGTLDLGDNGLKNLGNFLRMYSDDDSSDVNVTANGTFANYPGLLFTVIDPGVPVRVFAIVNAVVQAKTTGTGVARLRPTIDGNAPLVAAQQSYGIEPRSITAIQVHDFNPTGNFSVRAQVRVDSGGFDGKFTQANLIALVFPQ